ncbi:unnamed protein product [Pleuronectes platessa]|uniref:Uncharacterized protein n=1 Tax=Pleuronectes platessa TaxID=8262 RepID=A0A9N7YXF0_PLEPL|nr:unnamed protein product [Pleuronectes platessa]
MYVEMDLFADCYIPLINAVKDAPQMGTAQSAKTTAYTNGCTLKSRVPEHLWSGPRGTGTMETLEQSSQGPFTNTFLGKPVLNLLEF